MSKQDVTTSKMVKVKQETHKRIYQIADRLEVSTGIRHNADNVVSKAVSLLEKKVGL